MWERNEALRSRFGSAPFRILVDPERSGEGWMWTVFGEADAFVAWFTYDDQGRQAWMVATGTVDGSVIEFPNMLFPLGGLFGRRFDPSLVDRQSWGTLRFEFADCNTLAVEYTSEAAGFESGSGDSLCRH